MIERAPGPAAPVDIAAAAQMACLLEVSSPKPGNVSPGRHFDDTRYEDFLASAVAIGGPLAGAAARPLGATIRLAIEATARWTRSNTNLGMVLLLAPLARAALEPMSDPEAAFQPQTLEHADPASSHGATLARESPRHPGPAPAAGPGLQTAIRRVLDGTTVEDAREVYHAIRLAAPGGLGRADTQDVSGDPTMTLLEVMRIAADRDGIAREYASGFETTFGAGAPALRTARRDGLPWAEAVVETFLTLLAASPDTHIARRAGQAAADDVSRMARTILDAGGVRSDEGRRSVDEMDRRLRDPRNTANPGTTADLTAAAIFVVLLEGGWR
jgi:triphosphoribosyl-dephospho-CoA synthase